jgi:hypothetical protein
MLTKAPNNRYLGGSHNQPEIFSGFLTLRLRFPSENVMGIRENRPDEVLRFHCLDLTCLDLNPRLNQAKEDLSSCLMHSPRW